jgi:hypothetical protein
MGSKRFEKRHTLRLKPFREQFWGYIAGTAAMQVGVRCKRAIEMCGLLNLNLTVDILSRFFCKVL